MLRCAHGQVELVGDVMADVSLAFASVAEERSHALEQHGVEPGGYLLVTAHRAGNVDDPDRLRLLVELLEALPGTAIFPLHPRTRARLEAADLLGRQLPVRLAEPANGIGEIEIHAERCATDTAAFVANFLCSAR